MIHALTYIGDGSTKTVAALLTASGNYPNTNPTGGPLGMRLNWLQAVNEGSGTARFGDVNTTVSYGLAIPSTAGMMLPPVHQMAHCYSPSSIYLYTPIGTVVSLMFDA